jgi:hypothetical protein
MQITTAESRKFLSLHRLMVLGGIALLAMASVMGIWSQKLWAWAWESSDGIYVVVGLGVFAGAVYLMTVGSLRQSAERAEPPARAGRRRLAWIALTGLLMRVVLLHCAPERGSDTFRYMWDGALSAHGLSPYLYTPDDGKRALADTHADPRLKAVAKEAGKHLDWINHPHIQTIYPPLAQAAFLIANRIEPWSASAWRVVLLAFDLVTFGLLILLVYRLRLPIVSLAIYWWNPLLISEFYCAGHVDAIVLPFVVGALLLAIQRRTTLSMLCLAGAVAAKFWPLILLPLLVRSALRRPRRLAFALAMFALAAAVLLLPMLVAGRSGVAGIVSYARAWQSNDGLFRLNVLLWQRALPWLGQPAWAAQMAARWTTAILLLAWVLWLARRPSNDPLELCESCLLAVAALFLLSPTQFPWYYTWVVPLLALRPRWSLLAYTALLPLYYLYYVHDRHGPWIWVEHVPVWLLLTLESILRTRRSESTVPSRSPSNEPAIVPTSAH